MVYNTLMGYNIVTEAMAQKIRSQYLAGFTLNNIAKRYGLSLSTVQRHTKDIRHIRSRSEEDNVPTFCPWCEKRMSDALLRPHLKKEHGRNLPTITSLLGQSERILTEYDDAYDEEEEIDGS